MRAVPSSPPQDVRCTALSSQSLQVSWDPPPDTSLNGILKGYKVMYENMDAITDTTKIETKTTTVLTVGLSNLEKHTNYSVQVGYSPMRRVTSTLQAWHKIVLF